jgi:hypothetical protein
MLLSLVDYEMIPNVIRPNVPAIIFPNFFLKNDLLLKSEDLFLKSQAEAFLTRLTKKPSMIFNAKTVITFDILNNLSVLLTFGLCSPFLTLIISFAIFLKLNMWRILFGRFLNIFNFENNQRNEDDDAKINRGSNQIIVTKKNISPYLIALNHESISLNEVFYIAVWPILWSSAAFFGFICWDMAVDKVGVRNSVWIFVLAMIFPAILYLVLKIEEGPQVSDWLYRRKTRSQNLSVSDGVLLTDRMNENSNSSYDMNDDPSFL